jgi:hypothetical protein
VFWRPRTSFGKLAKQFYCYGTGRGQTQIGATDFLYNLRNLLLVCIAVSCSFLSPWVTPLAAALFVYFYVWTFHEKAARIARRTGSMRAYPLTLVVLWTVMMSNLLGYLRGSWERWRGAEQFRTPLDRYLLA